ncbi:hypothetical protein PVAND_008541 [Polypedilum vanderplanki]
MDKEEDFDYFQEVARSAFADMLFDEERNRKYSEALKWAINETKRQGKKANVLDIGTGSGLLAMLAARHKADSVTTIEAFSPISSVAKRVIEANGYKDKIKMINKHSTAVEVGKGKDIEQKANILVAELLDTELIGEGAIKSYNEAHQHLIDKDCLCVPHSASIYVQIVDSRLASSWFSFQEFSINEVNTIKAPDNVKNCRGLASIHDLQLNQFPLNEFKSITEPINICQIDFSGNIVIPYKESFKYKFKSSMNTESVVIFFWWSIYMTKNHDILLSCAPHWAYPDTNNTLDEVTKRNALPFRDHWMQGIYFVPKSLKKDNEYILVASHDEFSWSFDVHFDTINEQIERPICCSCIFHMCNSRNKIMQINDESKRLAFMEIMRRTELQNVLFIGDHSLLSLIACHASNAKSINVLQKDELCFKSLKNFIEFNGFKNKIHLVNDLSQIQDNEITHVIAEPYFQNAVLPIDNIIEIYSIINELKKMTKQFQVVPRKAKIFAVPIHFLHLYKIRWPLKSSCEGFDHSFFDKVIERASEIADENVEAFSLWEYPSIAIGSATEVFEFNFNENKISKGAASVEIDNFSNNCNGIAFWIEWILDENAFSFSTGPSSSIISGELINWKFDRQAVHLIPYKHIVRGILSSIEIKSQFDTIEEKISFDFSYNYAE